MSEPNLNDSTNILAEAMRRSFSEAFEPLRKDTKDMRADMLAMEERLVVLTGGVSNTITQKHFVYDVGGAKVKPLRFSWTTNGSHWE